MGAQFDAVRGTLTAGGTGNVTLSSIAAGKGVSPNVLSVGWSGGIRFDAPDGTTWELTKCTMLAGLILQRDTVVAGSSGPGVKVTLPVGTIALQTALADDLNGTPLADFLASAPAGNVSGTDSVLAVQSNAAVGISMSALALFALSVYPSGKTLAVRITAAAAVPLDFTSHNRRRIVVTASGVTINGPTNYGTVSDDFECEVVNLSASVVTFGAGVSCLPAGTTLPANGVARLFSTAGVIYCMLPVAAAAGVAPGQVTGLATSNPTSSGMTASYAAPTTGTAPFSYTIQYRVTGGSTWTTAATGVSALSYTIAGLTPSTGYDVQVCAVGTGGTGTFSSVATGTTSAGALPAPGQVTALAAGTPTATAVPLSWAAPASGGAVASYTVQYRAGTTGSWLTFATGVTGLASTVMGLTAATAYQFQVIAINATGPGTASSAASATTAAGGGYAPGAAPFTATARAAFPLSIGTYTSDFWWHDVVATGGKTITSISSGVSTSNTVPPTAAINLGTNPKGWWFGSMSNYGGGTSYLSNENGVGISSNISPAVNFYFWIIIVDSDGNKWAFCHSAPTNIGDGVAKGTTGGATSTPQVQQ